MAFPCLNILTAFSSFLIIIIVGDIFRTKATAAEIDQEVRGEPFVKSIVHGESK